MTGIHPFTLGVEEEVFLCHPATGDLAEWLELSLMDDLADSLGSGLHLETMMAQVELVTPVCHNVGQLGQAIVRNRQRVRSIVSTVDTDILSAGFHPAAQWDRVRRRDSQVVRERATDYGILFFRGITGAFHLHVGLDERSRFLCIDRLPPFVPMLVALTVNSPLYGARNARMMGYRVALIGGRPRSGFFPAGMSAERYAVERLRLTRGIHARQQVENPSANYRFLGHVRPSHQYETLEFRFFDGTPYVSRLLPVFALTRALVRAIVAEPHRFDVCVSPAERRMADLNVWRAARDGAAAMLLSDFEDGVARERPVAALLDDALNRIESVLGADDEDVRRARGVDPSNLEARRQLASYDAAEAEGATAEQAALAACRAMMAVLETEIDDKC